MLKSSWFDWCNWLINDIPKPIKKTANKLLSLFKSNKIASSSGKKLSKPKIQKESQDKIINNIRNLFKLEKENKEIEEKIIGDIKKNFEQKEHYYKLVRVGSIWNNNYIEYESNIDRNKNLSINL